MIKYIAIFLTILLTSSYYFPFILVALPAVNSKMILAAVGLILVMQHWIKCRSLRADKAIINVFLCATFVSIAGLISVVYNGTSDYAYLTYVVSMAVWLSAAFVVCATIQHVHGVISIRLLCNYIIAACCLQCLIVLLIEFVPVVKNVVDTIFVTGYKTMDRINRLYGIGCLLDVGGSRFAACLVIITSVLVNDKQVLSNRQVILYIFAFMTIAIVGNMVARTTTVGLVLSFVYLIISMKYRRVIQLKANSIKIFIRILFVVFLIVIFMKYLYDTNNEVNSLLRFAFEGFFNLFEGGSFETASTNALKNMFVWPESLKTWLIGDGYFNNPHNVDPYYVGQTPTWGYYMGTDAGYSRFIFYFGLLGLLAFSVFMIYAASVCIKNAPTYSYMFILLVVCNFCVWIKVSTDLFVVIALFVCSTTMMAKASIKQVNR